MKGKKNKHKQLKPILKKSMLAALSLGIALPAVGALPQVQAGEIEPLIKISRPVLNDGIEWLSYTSDPSLVPSAAIEAGDNTVMIDLSTHFPTDQFTQLSAISNDTTVARAYVNDENKLVVVPFRSGHIKIELKAQYRLSEALDPVFEPVTDNIELYISKKGDLNGDDKVDSADAALLFRYLRDMTSRRGYSYVEMNQADIDRNGQPAAEDMNALLKGYASGALGAKDNSYVLTFQQVYDAPYAFNGKLEGTMQTQQTISGTYTHLDIDGYNPINYPPNTKYQWYTATDELGNGEEIIQGATSDKYTIRDIDEHQYLILKVTPRSYLNQQLEGKTLVIRGTQAVEGPPPPP
ncbi:dockerin type I repeat-containing protein [Paenibacillus sp. FSL R7-0652]|uniref:dockerin type I repeat-containing protein n=1 Tax=Paenibacillus sp. FSL R7-0652 TaxID=2921687 RepID=UPI00315A7C98